MEGKITPFSKNRARRPEARDGPAWAASPAGADVSPGRSKATDHEPYDKENGTRTTQNTTRITQNHTESHRMARELVVYHDAATDWIFTLSAVDHDMTPTLAECLFSLVGHLLPVIFL
jgi:hypothetical protein